LSNKKTAASPETSNEATRVRCGRSCCPRSGDMPSTLSTVYIPTGRGRISIESSTDTGSRLQGAEKSTKRHRARETREDLTCAPRHVNQRFSQVLKRGQHHHKYTTLDGSRPRSRLGPQDCTSSSKQVISTRRVRFSQERGELVKRDEARWVCGECVDEFLVEIELYRNVFAPAE